MCQLLHCTAVKAAFWVLAESLLAAHSASSIPSAKNILRVWNLPNGKGPLSVPQALTGCANWHWTSLEKLTRQDGYRGWTAMACKALRRRQPLWLKLLRASLPSSRCTFELSSAMSSCCKACFSMQQQAAGHFVRVAMQAYQQACLSLFGAAHCPELLQQSFIPTESQACCHMQRIQQLQAADQPAELQAAAQRANELLLFEAHNTLARLLQDHCCRTSSPVMCVTEPDHWMGLCKLLTCIRDLAPRGAAESALLSPKSCLMMCFSRHSRDQWCVTQQYIWTLPVQPDRTPTGPSICSKLVAVVERRQDCYLPYSTGVCQAVTSSAACMFASAGVEIRQQAVRPLQQCRVQPAVASCGDPTCRLRTT